MSRAPTIVGVEAIPLAVEGRRDFRISEGGTRRHASVLVRLLTSEPGLEGHGEVVSAPPGKPEEYAEETVAAIQRFVAPALLEVRATDRALATERVERALKGRIWTKAAVTNALYDLAGKALGVSVVDLLGGAVTDRIPVIGPVIGMATPDAMAERAVAHVARGFRTLKLKVGETVGADVARVAAVREAVGPDVTLRVDANDHYRAADAVRLVRAIERFDLEHVEQPLARADILGMAALRAKVGVPIMTDDMVATPMDAMNVIRLGAADRVKVKVSKHGLDGARLILGMLEAAGLVGVLGHVVEMGLAAAAEANLALAARNVAPPHEIGSLEPLGVEEDIVTEDLAPSNGEVRLPNGVGLGVTLDWARVERFRTDRR